MLWVCPPKEEEVVEQRPAAVEDGEDESDGRARQRLAQFSRLKYGD